MEAVKTEEIAMQNETGNHMMPFLWLKGEGEATIREYMRVIHDSGINAVCVESRPHPDFLGNGWWKDMDVILEEAENLCMKVWILDDSHFPTGYAAGAVRKAPFHLHRQGICYKRLRVKGRRAHISIDRFLKEKNGKLSLMDMGKLFKKEADVLPEDSLLSVTGMEHNTNTLVDLTEKVSGGKLLWDIPEGTWSVGICKLSFRCGAHRDYINMMDEESCRILLDTVYEPHFAHYGNQFGNTIAGFFSDEPELGNGALYSNERLGYPQDLPWSRTLVPLLEKKLGREWKNKLVYLWEQGLNADETAKVRYAYMDTVTARVRDAFSCQIGDWCRSKGVEYIGHVVEDNNSHARTGGSLGHYFRGLAGQDMAGIDDIGGQVMPQGEDGPDSFMHFVKRDGEFYHYILGRLGPSLAAIDPKKKGRAMCEIFGNYGWAEGLRLEKYLLDHFLVNGVNYFVPHAFSMAPFPDPDCPPHFYAHGHNPQYRHFKSLMEYAQRVAGMCDGGHHVCDIALLYHGEAEWAGEAMLMQETARKLTDNQFNFDIVPLDAFTDMGKYQTDLSEGLTIHAQTYQAFIIPYAEYLSEKLLDALDILRQQDVEIIFINGLPKGVYDFNGEKTKVTGKISSFDDCVCPLEELEQKLQNIKKEVTISPAEKQIRYLHYRKETDYYLFVNQGNSRYEGIAEIVWEPDANLVGYEPWRDEKHQITVQRIQGKLQIPLVLEPSQSYMVLAEREDEIPAKKPFYERIKGKEVEELNGGWKRSICTAVQYPSFGKEQEVSLPDDVSEQFPKFSGWICYRKVVWMEQTGETILEITDAYEGVEVIVNGKSAGVQVVPAYYFDITGLIKQGENEIRIEVSTTLERERAYSKNQSFMERLQKNKVLPPSGINGRVFLWSCKDSIK